MRIWKDFFSAESANREVRSSLSLPSPVAAGVGAVSASSSSGASSAGNPAAGAAWGDGAATAGAFSPFGSIGATLAASTGAMAGWGAGSAAAMGATGTGGTGCAAGAVEAALTGTDADSGVEASGVGAASGAGLVRTKGWLAPMWLMAATEPVRRTSSAICSSGVSLGFLMEALAMMKEEAGLRF